ncbi:polysaccharide deacetylase family protein [Thermohalobacter berrensis]|uniref:NodB homology domain-containing protein n=1 Tax=Thermohalobacter berrensis TaxID=99594 RepID=A0A419T9L9_9FIRM|nr:polysaccharide deacetylase family protein [Thermohalobacter berrensis]RKD34163.1 hypothetical protein BET03_07690 [Thermohalobacter berrensis]
MNNFPDKKTIYLTFDDGPSKNTIKILDILKKYKVKATFFVCGNTTEFGKKVYKRIVNEGHAIGNHTFSHNYKVIYSSEEAFLKDLKKLENFLFSVAGVKPKIIRFPGGSNTSIGKKYGGIKLTERLTTKVLLDGYQYFDWNVSSRDATKVTQDKEIIINSVLQDVKDGGNIVLFHDSWPKTTTVEALPTIIEELLKRGYRFDILTKDSFYVHFL